MPIPSSEPVQRETRNSSLPPGVSARFQRLMSAESHSLMPEELQYTELRSS
jgi:hypothetical protein